MWRRHRILSRDENVDDSWSLDEEDDKWYSSMVFAGHESDEVAVLSFGKRILMDWLCVFMKPRSTVIPHGFSWKRMLILSLQQCNREAQHLGPRASMCYEERLVSL